MVGHRRGPRKHVGRTCEHRGPTRPPPAPAVPADATSSALDVPDPYYDGMPAFTDVLEVIRASCTGLLATVRTQLGGDRPIRAV